MELQHPYTFHFISEDAPTALMQMWERHFNLSVVSPHVATAELCCSAGSKKCEEFVIMHFASSGEFTKITSYSFTSFIQHICIV